MTAKPAKTLGGASPRLDAQDLPELAPFRPAATADQVLAKETVKLQSANVNKRLIARSKAVVAVAAMSLVSLVQTLVTVLPIIRGNSVGGGEFGLALLLFLFNIVLQFATFCYFCYAKDPDFAANVLKGLLVFNGSELLMGLFATSSLLVTFVDLLAILYAYTRMPELKYGGS